MFVAVPPPLIQLNLGGRLPHAIPKTGLFIDPVRLQAIWEADRGPSTRPARCLQPSFRRVLSGRPIRRPATAVEDDRLLCR